MLIICKLFGCVLKEDLLRIMIFDTDLIVDSGRKFNICVDDPSTHKTVNRVE